MTILAIDAGNTRIKWGVRDGAVWTQQDALPTAEAARLREALAPAHHVERAVIANVAGERVAQALASALPPGLESQWVVSRAEQCGVRSGYADPAKLGADRWA